MVDLDCTSPQERGKADMAVADMCCHDNRFVGRIVDCPDIEGIVVAIADIGRAWFGTAEIAGSDSLLAGLVMPLD
jgi:hypothetical protein